MAMGKDETWRERDRDRHRDSDSSEAWLIHQPLIVALPPLDADQPAKAPNQPVPDAEQRAPDIGRPEPEAEPATADADRSQPDADRSQPDADQSEPNAERPAPDIGPEPDTDPTPDADQPELNIDWPESDPDWPDPDPNVLDEDSWHPIDFRRRTFTGHAAGPTLCRVGWMAFDPETPAGNESEETWASVNAAYWTLPNPLAIESIILAHVGLAHRIVSNMAHYYYPDAMRLEPKGFASIAEDWFSMALLKMLRVIVGDRKRKSKSSNKKDQGEKQDLRCTGRRLGWDRGEVDVPKQIAKYLATAIKREIRQTYEKEKTAREHTLKYLLKRQSFYKGDRINKQDQGKFHQAEIVRCDGGRFVAFHEETPDKIVAERESLDATLDAACGDVSDRLILLMKRDGATQTRIGKELDLSRGQVQRRLEKVWEAMQGDVELPPDEDEQSKKANGKSQKRAKRKAPSVLWDAEERRRWNAAVLRDQGIVPDELNPALIGDD